MNKVWIVTYYNEDFRWIYKYTSNCFIYDKTNTLREVLNIKHQKNVGYNIYDITDYITTNYYALPDVCVFIKSNVFKHCKQEVFNELIKNDTFTPLEYYGAQPANSYEARTVDGGFMELNNSWYIPAHIQTYGKEVCRYFMNYDEFLDEMFEKPEHFHYIRFSPGGNYIVPKENIRYYSLPFWKKLMGYVDYHQMPVEAHIIERALYYIFTNRFTEKEI